MNTPINYKEVANFFNGGVIIREIPTFSDSRGSLTEVFRTDDDVSNQAKLCYTSKTNSFVKRGFHYHEYQTDNFINWGNNNNKMVYQFISKDLKETTYFITDPTKIYSIKVEKNILHAYRNISSTSQSLTLNFTDQLFKGYMKKEEPDEIRFEEKYPIEKILFVFGAGGKLGKALTATAHQEMRIDNYDVIPCFDKIKNEEEFKAFRQSLDYALTGKHITFFNCAGLTNTKEAGPMNAEWTWTNINLPLLFAEMCSERNWEFIQISTNYVYQSVKPGVVNYFVSRYTQSKKDMESIMFGSINKLKTNTTTIIRVANLFSKEPNDVNIFTRFKEIIATTGKIAVDPSEVVTPTDVDVLSKKLVSLFKEGYFKTSSIQKLNIIPMQYNLRDFVIQNFGITPDGSVSKIDQGFKDFSSDPTAKIINI